MKSYSLPLFAILACTSVACVASASAIELPAPQASVEVIPKDAAARLISELTVTCRESLHVTVADFEYNAEAEVLMISKLNLEKNPAPEKIKGPEVFTYVELVAVPIREVDSIVIQPDDAEETFTFFLRPKEQPLTFVKDKAGVPQLSRELSCGRFGETILSGISFDSAARLAMLTASLAVGGEGAPTVLVPDAVRDTLAHGTFPSPEREAQILEEVQPGLTAALDLGRDALGTSADTSMGFEEALRELGILADSLTRPDQQVSFHYSQEKDEVTVNTRSYGSRSRVDYEPARFRQNRPDVLGTTSGSSGSFYRDTASFRPDQVERIFLQYSGGRTGCTLALELAEEEDVIIQFSRLSPESAQDALRAFASIAVSRGKQPVVQFLGYSDSGDSEQVASTSLPTLRIRR